MIIHSLRLQNYRKHKDTFIEFPDGLFGIVGNNGSGKTTIIEAVAYAIYGSHASRTGQKMIKCEQADPASDCRVELEFSLGSDAYRVVRELRGARQSAYAALYVNGNQEVEGTHPVTRYLSKRIGMDHKSFFTSIFAKQKELDVLSGLDPGERKKRVLRLLGVDRIDTAIDNVRRERRESESRISGIKGTLQDIDKMVSSVENLRKAGGLAKQKLEAERDALSSAKKELVRAKKAYDVMERKHNRHQALDKHLHGHDTEKRSHERNLSSKKEELAGLEGDRVELQNIRPKLKHLPSIKAKKEKLDEMRGKFQLKNSLAGQLSDADGKIRSMIENRRSLSLRLKQVKNLDSDLRDVKRQISAHAKRIGLLDRQIASKNAIITQLKKQRREATSEFTKLKKLGPKGRCMVCKKVVGNEFPEIIKHFNGEISEMTRKIDAATGQIQELSKRSEQANRLIVESKRKESSINRVIKQKIRDKKEKEDLDSQIKSEIQERNKLLKDIRKIGPVRYDEDEHEKLKESFAGLSSLDETRISLEAKTSRIPVVKGTIRSLQKSILAASKKIEKITAVIKAVGFDEEQYQQARKDYTLADQAHHKKDKDLMTARNNLGNILRDIRSTITQISQEKKKRRQMAEEERKIEILNALDRVFGEFRLDLISRIRPMLSLHSSELFRKLTDGKYPSMTVDENYDIQIEDDGKQFPLERFSGGEEDLASLCLRIAISQVIEQRAGVSAIEFIALDEIFGSQDESRRNNIMKALNELSTQFRQVILITHIDDIKDTLPYAFNVIETLDKSSKVISEGSPKMSLSA